MLAVARRLRVVSLFAVASAVATTPGIAQRNAPTPEVADSLVRVAMGHAEGGDTAAAIATLARLNRIAPRYAPAFYQRGVLLSRTTQLGLSDLLRRREATRYLNRALDLDSDNPFYLMELGRVRLKTPFLRLDAERLFRKALAAAERRGDPVVIAEIHWELGLIHERRFVTMANRRMMTGNSIVFNPDVAVGDWHYTPEFLEQFSQPLPDAGELDFRKAEEHYRIALRTDPGHRGASLGLLGLLYDAKRYEEMIRLATELRPALPLDPRLYFAHGLALHRLDRDVEAEAQFDTALRLLPAEEREEMLGLSTILRRADAVAYDTLSGAGRAMMDSLYWGYADPLRLTEVNEAQLEFYARVAAADLRFSSAEFRTQGWRTDRGEVLIRYGEPPVIATFAPETQTIEGNDAIAKVTTVWWYPASKRRFVFVGPPAMNYATYAGEFRAYAENMRHIAPISFDNLGDRLHVDSVRVQIARFRADSGGAAEVAIYADIPTRQMLRDVEVAQGTLETGLFLSDQRQRPVTSVRDSALVRPQGRDGLTSRAWTRRLAVGEYLYRVEAREAASGRSARGLSAFKVDAYPRGQFALSDLLAARRIVPKVNGESVRDRSDLFITPNASLTYAPADTVYLYWEVYGARPDSSGNAHLRVNLALRLTELQRGRVLTARVLGGVADAVGLSAEGDDRVSLRYDRRVALDSRDLVPNYLALNLGDAPYGTYVLELTVTDLVSGRTSIRERTITIPRP